VSQKGFSYRIMKRWVFLAGILIGSVSLGLGATAVEDGTVAKRPPKPVHTVAPEHPADLYKQGIPGEVMVRFVVDKTGKVKDPEIISASHEAFIAPTLAALEQWQFEPGLKNGKPADFKVSIPIDFKIPLGAQLKRILGRDIMVELDGPIVPAKDLGEIPTPEKWLVPPYPKSLIGSGKSGRAIVSFVINKQGLIVNPEVSKADNEDFAIAALLTVCRLRYPVIRGAGGEAIFVRANIEFPFRDPGAAPAAKPE
jgi:TonB family protein